MDKDLEFLNFIYQNSEMGKSTIHQLLSIVTDTPFHNMLQSQKREYDEINNIAQTKIEEAQKESKGISPFSKLQSYIMINLNTMVNHTPSHIAEMMIQGSTMGIVDITKNLKKYDSADKSIIKLGERLLKFEQENIEELKKYL